MADDINLVSGDHSDDDFVLLEDELGRLARELTADDVELDSPPPDLWSAIEAEAGLVDEPSIGHATTADTGPDAGTGGEHEPGGAGLRTSRIGTPRGLGVLPGGAVPSTAAEPAARSGLYGIPAALAAAAVLALVLATGAALIVRTVNADEVVAQAEIGNDGLPVALDGAGTAVLKLEGDDQFLELELPVLDAVDANSVYEVWMLDSEADGMVSLGNLHDLGGDTARIDLPDNIDHTRFPVVDISVEPLDGDPTHSGQSVLRGVLTDVDGA